MSSDVTMVVCSRRRSDGQAALARSAMRWVLALAPALLGFDGQSNKPSEEQEQALWTDPLSDRSPELGEDHLDVMRSICSSGRQVARSEVRGAGIAT